MAAQTLPRGVLHSLAELDAEPQRLYKVEPGATDPANQVPTLNQFQNNVRLALDDLDRVRLDDVGMLTELHPEPALGGKPRPPDLVTQQFVLQGLECDHRPTGFAQMVVDHVDQAHSTFVHVEDLESVTDPVAHTPDAHHEQIPHPRISSPCGKPPILPEPLYARSSLWFGHPPGPPKEFVPGAPSLETIPSLNSAGLGSAYVLGTEAATTWTCSNRS